jgi:large subunit ribosomal protein L9
MEIILLEKVHNLGKVGDKVNVKSGYGRNFLIPGGKAVPATKENLIKFEAYRAQLEKTAAENLTLAQSRAAAIAKLTILIQSKVGEEGKLYGSVGTRDIAEVITGLGQKVSKSEIRLPHGVIRKAGEHEVGVYLHPDVILTVSIHVVPES